MLSYYSPPDYFGRLSFVEFPKKVRNVVVCAAKGPRPRYPRVWKTRTKIGTVSKSLKLIECIKGLSNVKEEVYGALDSFIAWDLEFPLITVKKALKALEHEKEWKRIIQVTKWMLSKGQGRTMGSYYLLLHALAEDGRIDEAEELWTKLFSDNLQSMPRIFFDRMIAIYYKRDMHDKMFEHQKLKNKYPPPKWEYRYIKGKRVKIRSENLKKPVIGNKEINEFSNETDNDEDSNSNSDEDEGGEFEASPVP
ncbi:hypothetical protein E3N88_02808 [Mikania micrantha]|uniref:Pentatricopeptide repeat-containing protein n=1 Tax=Mikania micrantha TaxID=192012 RepID=A0A5N6Q505_9ASTR|nr:hypothetical protein E3N88_02808 [Mikania micrantha]